MKRREFIAGLGGAALVASHEAWGQVLPVIGFLHSGSQASYGHVVGAFQKGLAEKGYDPAAMTILYRWAEDRFDRLPTLAAELVRQKVSLIFAGGGEVTALAAKSATSTIPIVFAIGADPVRHGIVASMNRPDGNITGTSFLVVEIRPKMVELTRELLPNAKRVALLVNPNRPGFEEGVTGILGPAMASGLEVLVFKAGNSEEIDVAFVSLARSSVDAVLFLSDPVYVSRRDQIGRLLLSHKLPGINASREHVVAGSLISYGASLEDAVAQAGAYAARILKGEKPADLPVMQPTKFYLVINLKIATAIGVTVPPTLLARADEVIE